MNRPSGNPLLGVDVPAVWKGKLTVLRCRTFDPSRTAANQARLSHWVSPAGDESHDVAVGAVPDSLGAPP